jgi:predicted nucleotidyltransferase
MFLALVSRITMYRLRGKVAAFRLTQLPQLPRGMMEWSSTMARTRIEIPTEKVAEFCRRNHIRKLALFGSVLREDFRPHSDVDVLVEFEEGHVPGLRFFALEEELSDILGRKVDLNTRAFLSRYFRDQAVAEAEDQYVAP